MNANVSVNARGIGIEIVVETGTGTETSTEMIDIEDTMIPQVAETQYRRPRNQAPSLSCPKMKSSGLSKKLSMIS
jgi:hypothetical protein